MTESSRWKLRYSEFSKSLKSLEKAIMVKNPDEIYRAGLIQYFEMTFELAWKTLKDYLTDQGFIIRSPRQSIQQAFESEIINDGHSWIVALEKRNLVSHTYDDAVLKEIETLIRSKYILIFRQLDERLSNDN